MTSIQWTDATWNPTRGCSRVSAGCENCYAERTAARFQWAGRVRGNGVAPQSQGLPGPYHGLVTVGPKGPRWTGAVRLVPEKLSEPLGWRKPRRVFVDSMSDLFHEAIPEDYIAAVFGVMAACPQHSFQVLTKRPERARQWFSGEFDNCKSTCSWFDRAGLQRGCGSAFDPDAWPLPNVWLGVSVEDQATADERIPLLEEIPAAVRFVSYEPALGPVDFERIPRALFDRSEAIRRCMAGPVAMNREQADATLAEPFVDWVIVGGESGPGARPFDVAWARSTIAQCKAAGVPCFVKQLGSGMRLHTGAGRGRYVHDGPDSRLVFHNSKGGNPSEWPKDLRVREWPEVSNG